eukprot:scaffold4420_cov187-Amphora_coffeaeformis.AAC.30
MSPGSGRDAPTLIRFVPPQQQRPPSFIPNDPTQKNKMSSDKPSSTIIQQSRQKTRGGKNSKKVTVAPKIKSPQPEVPPRAAAATKKKGVVKKKTTAKHKRVLRRQKAKMVKRIDSLANTLGAMLVLEEPAAHVEDVKMKKTPRHRRHPKKAAPLKISAPSNVLIMDPTEVHLEIN